SFDRGFLYRFDARPENLDVEGSGKKRQRDHGPFEASEHRLGNPILVHHSWHLWPEREVEKVHLNQRGGVPEELDVPLNDRLEDAMTAALKPSSDDADDDA